MKDVIGFLLYTLLFVSCSQTNNDNIAYRITEKDLIPEGITYSPTTNSFYISSIFKTKIVQINADNGEFKDFIPSDLLNLEFLGMISDDTHNFLWACGNKTIKGDRISKVVKLNINSGELVKSYSFNDSCDNTYNDIVYDTAGNIYFTNSQGNQIYKIDKQSDLVDIFYHGIEIDHPNGITISPDNKFLYIASTSQGIRVLDIEKRVIIGEPDISINSKGIDGLKYYKNSLIGIQNAVEEKSQIKISRFFLDKSGTKINNMEIIDQNNSLFDIPTTFVIVKNHLYCLANSQVENIRGSDCEIINPKALQDVLILEYELYER